MNIIIKKQKTGINTSVPTIIDLTIDNYNDIKRSKTLNKVLIPWDNVMIEIMDVITRHLYSRSEYKSLLTVNKRWNAYLSDKFVIVEWLRECPQIYLKPNALKIQKGLESRGILGLFESLQKEWQAVISGRYVYTFLSQNAFPEESTGGSTGGSTGSDFIERRRNDLVIFIPYYVEDDWKQSNTLDNNKCWNATKFQVKLMEQTNRLYKKLCECVSIQVLGKNDIKPQNNVKQEFQYVTIINAKDWITGNKLVINVVLLDKRLGMEKFLQKYSLFFGTKAVFNGEDLTVDQDVFLKTVGLKQEYEEYYESLYGPYHSPLLDK